MTNQLAIREEMSLIDMGQVFYKSGFFTDVRDANQAIVKIMAGRELGFGAFTSMTGIHIINGKPAPGANLMASKVKSSGRYDYRVRQMDDTVCKIEFFQRVFDKWESIGVSEFTIEQARKAGVKNLEKYPRNMLFARAMSNGVKWFVPDIFDGMAVYTPEELGAETDENGDVIDAKHHETAMPVITITQPEQTPLDVAANFVTNNGTRFGDLTNEQLQEIIARSSRQDWREAAKIVFEHYNQVETTGTGVEP